MRTKGITLVEILVVVAIIALIAALLLPVLVQVRKRSYTVTCTSNLHQLVAAFQMYRQDYNGDHPTRQKYLWSYLKTLDILNCPADNTPYGAATILANPDGQLIPGPTATRTSYYYFADSLLSAEVQEGDRTFTYAEVLRQMDENHGVFACALHGEPVAGRVVIPRFDMRGLVLRARVDGSVQRAQVEFICYRTPDAPGLLGDRIDWLLFTDVRPIPEGLLQLHRGSHNWEFVPCAPPYN